jgi:hypothetical protein
MLNTDASRLRRPRKIQKPKTWEQSGNKRDPRRALAQCLVLFAFLCIGFSPPLMRACFIFLGEDYCLANIFR